MKEENEYRYHRRRESDQSVTPAEKREFLRSPSIHAPTLSGQIVNDIYEEFLVCKICLDSYTSPKCLSCLHTFCESCIENHISSEATYKKYSDYQNFTCPLCRKRTQVPTGGIKKLPDNFLVSSLLERMGPLRDGLSGECQFCDICRLMDGDGGPGAERQAVSKCLECSKRLCKACTQLHRETRVTREHALVDMSSEQSIACKLHSEEAVRFYCEPCQACICVVCTFNEHRDHEVFTFAEAVGKYRADIERLVGHCRRRLQAFEARVDQISRTEKVIKEGEQSIRDLSIDFISEIRQREKQLIDELHSHYGMQVMELIGRKAELLGQLESLRSTCNLTDSVLNGRDIELLLLKKEVQEKLLALSRVVDAEDPLNLTKEIRFHPGHLELGIIQDSEKAIPKPKCLQLLLGNGVNAEVQTEVEPEPQTMLTETECQTILPVLETVATATDPPVEKPVIEMEDKCINTSASCLRRNRRTDSVDVDSLTVPVVARETTSQERLSWRRSRHDRQHDDITWGDLGLED